MKAHSRYQKVLLELLTVTKTRLVSFLFTYFENFSRLCHCNILSRTMLQKKELKDKMNILENISHHVQLT